MSTLEVNKITPAGSGTTVTLGDSGDTFTIPSGATITNNGTASGFGLTNWSESSGNLLPSNASYGVYLGVNSATASNLLDDYEEGTFTPTFGGSTTDPTVSWNTQSGHYTKIGNIVHINLTFYPSAISGGSGNLNIRGLPFTNRNHRAPGSILYDRVRVQSNTTTVTPEIEQNTTYMAISEMRQGENETRGFIQVDDLEATTSDNPFIQITITYTTD